MQMRKNQGITLVALVVTIAILLILAGITFQYASEERGASSKVHEASFKTRWIGYKEQVELYVTNEILNKVENDKEKINSGEH